MNISGISNYYRASALLASQNNPVQQAFDKADTRISQQLQATEAQISALGKVQSGVAQVQSAGKALAATPQSATPAELKTSLQSFVKTYNDTLKAGNDSGPGTARNSVNNLRQAFSTDSARASLRQAGITQKSDGTLSFDSKAFDAAQQANPSTTLTAARQVGTVAEQTTTQTLSENGRLSTAMNALNARASALEARQAEQQNMANTAAQAMQQASATLTSTSASSAGISSYLRISRLET